MDQGTISPGDGEEIEKQLAEARRLTELAKAIAAKVAAQRVARQRQAALARLAEPAHHEPGEQDPIEDSTSGSTQGS